MSNIEIINKTFLLETISLKEKIELAFLELGKRLMKISDEKLYVGEYQNFEEYLMELEMSKGTASKLIAIYKKFVVEYAIDPEQLSKVPWTSLYQLLKIADTKEKAEELIQNAAISKMGYVENEVRQHEHPNCKHEDTYQLDICRICGRREKVLKN